MCRERPGYFGEIGKGSPSSLGNRASQWLTNVAKLAAFVPVAREPANLWSVQGRVDLHGAQHNTRELEVAIDLLLVTREFVDTALDALERLNVAKILLCGLPVQQDSPVVHCKTFDCEAKLECCIRKRCGVLAFGARR